MASELLPDVTYVRGTFEPGWSVRLADDGSIAGVGPPDDPSRCVRLNGQALMPGMVNGHSHSFQRCLRGRTEYRTPEVPTDDFWTWRERMYDLATALSPEDVEVVSRMLYVEMALSGITTVGEFHYLHHQPDGTPYDDPDEMAWRVAAAARNVGISLVMLRSSYARAGFNRPVEPRQARFIDSNPEACVESVRRLRSGGLKVGVAPHSVRAVPLSWLTEIGRFAQEERLPLHIHLAEQVREVRECETEYGMRPAQMLIEQGLVDSRFTGVHGVQVLPGEMERLGREGATICACPTTERNLGDGIVPAVELLAAGSRISLGTDSQCQINLLEDARELEYHLRLQHRQRVLMAPEDEPASLAVRLFDCATRSGAHSLGLKTGSLEPGLSADLMAVDLNDPSICGTPVDDLLAAVVFGMERTAVRNVWIGGRQVVCDGRHADQESAVREYTALMKRFEK